MVALFISANPLSGAFAGPVSGAILARTSILGGLRPWQLLFLVEGLPSVLVGIATLLYLVDADAAAAAGIAWINSLGNLAGSVSPFLVGRIRDATGIMTLAAQFVLSGSCLVSSAVVLVVIHRWTRNRGLIASSAIKTGGT